MQIAQIAFQGLSGLSFLGTAGKSLSLKKLTSYALAESLISVFFIFLAVVIVALIAISLMPALTAPSSVAEEKTAYLPGQYVSQQLNSIAGSYLAK